MEGSPSGQSKKQHLLKVWKQMGRMPEELEGIVNPPEELFYLWEWLKDHTYPLSFAELESWMRVTGRPLAKWQVLVMVELDKVRSYG